MTPVWADLAAVAVGLAALAVGMVLLGEWWG